MYILSHICNFQNTICLICTMSYITSSKCSTVYKKKGPICTMQYQYVHITTKTSKISSRIRKKKLVNSIPVYLYLTYNKYNFLSKSKLQFGTSPVSWDSWDIWDNWDRVDSWDRVFPSRDPTNHPMRFSFEAGINLGWNMQDPNFTLTFSIPSPNKPPPKFLLTHTFIIPEYFS